MKTTKIILTVLLFVFALSFSMVNGVSGKEVDKLKIGLMFGLTGAGSPIGPVQLEGAKLAVKEINEGGGAKIGGKKVPVEFVVRDDETKPDVALRRFRELVYEDKVQAIVGSTFAAISALTDAHRVLAPKVVQLLRERNAGDIMVILGGFIQQEDIAFLKEAGIAEVFASGTRLQNIVDSIKQRVRK